MNLSEQLKSIATEGAIAAGAKVSPDMEALLQDANIKHSRNGDPINHLLESLQIKLSFAMQDPTVLAEITDAEIEMLTMEVNAAKQETVNDGF